MKNVMSFINEHRSKHNITEFTLVYTFVVFTLTTLIGLIITVPLILLDMSIHHLLGRNKLG